MEVLRCDIRDCVDPVSMIDDRGWIYCADHGLDMRSYYRRVRKLRPHELNRLKRGEKVKSY